MVSGVTDGAIVLVPVCMHSTSLNGLCMGVRCAVSYRFELSGMEIFRWPRMFVRFRFLLRSGDVRGGGEEEGIMTICGYRFSFEMKDLFFSYPPVSSSTLVQPCRSESWRV